MNRIKNIALSIFLTLGAFTAVTVTSCNTDECKDVVCNNGGTCVGGSCSCLTGYEGVNCQTEVRASYAGDYKGSGTDNSGGTYTNWTISFASAGTTATNMNMILKNGAGATVLTLPVQLTTNTTYQITSTTVGSFTYSGSGTVSPTVATATINQAGSPNLVLTFNNMVRQ
jgi:hypothetical protein